MSNTSYKTGISPTAAEPESAVPTEIFSIFTCQTCRKMFVAVPGYLEKPLPCGHTPSVWAMASSVMDDLQDSEFVEWMYQNDLLDRPVKKLKQCGGDFVFHLAGQRRFKRPTKSMLGGFDDDEEE